MPVCKVCNNKFPFLSQMSMDGQTCKACANADIDKFLQEEGEASRPAFGRKQLSGLASGGRPGSPVFAITFDDISKKRQLEKEPEKERDSDVGGASSTIDRLAGIRRSLLAIREALNQKSVYKPMLEATKILWTLDAANYDLLCETDQGALLYGSERRELVVKKQKRELASSPQILRPSHKLPDDKNRSYARSNHNLHCQNLFGIQSKVGLGGTFRDQKRGRSYVGNFGNVFQNWITDQKLVRDEASDSGTKKQKGKFESDAKTFHDDNLNYRNALCELIVGEFGALSGGGCLTVKHDQQSYPCVAVHLNLYPIIGEPGEKVDKLLCRDLSRDSWVKNYAESTHLFFMCIFLGVCNYLSSQAGSGIVLVRRSSFGHNGPTVDDAGYSFRINVGIMNPDYYTQVIGKGLKILSGIVAAYRDNAYGDGKRAEIVLTEFKERLIKKGYEKYIGSKASKSFAGLGAFRDLSLFCIEKGNKPHPYFYHLTRSKESCDAINVFTYNYLYTISNADNLDGGTLLIEIFSQLLKYTNLANSALTTSGSFAEEVFQYSEPVFYVDEKKDCTRDKAAWKTFGDLCGSLKQMMQQLAIEASTKQYAEGLNAVFLMIGESVGRAAAGQAFGFDLTLEYANEAIYLYGVNQCIINRRNRRDDESSDSDVDTDRQIWTGDHKLWDIQKGLGLSARKYLCNGGMRAICNGLQAGLEIVEALNEKLVTENKLDAVGLGKAIFGGEVTGKDDEISLYVHPQMYFEVENALKILRTPLMFQKKNVRIVDNRQPLADCTNLDLFLGDLNPFYAKSSAKPEQLEEFLAALKKARVRIWILDYTSSTSGQMVKVLTAFHQNVAAQCVLFVGSGLKNEQLGADKNNYGTIRCWLKKDIRSNNIGSFTLGSFKFQDDVFQIVKNIVKRNEVPLQLVCHHLRRIYKDLGCIPTNGELLLRLNEALAAIDHS